MKIAVIGGYGHHSLLSLVEARELDLVGISGDGHETESTSFGYREDYPSTPFYEDFRVMLEEKKPDIVSIGAQYAFNGRIARYALERGIRVVSEKPIAGSWGDLSALDHAVKQSQLPVIPEFTMRWYPAFIAARNAIASGVIGKPVLISAQKSYPFRNRPDFYKSRMRYSGTICWVAVHAIDFVRWCTGVDYSSIMAFQGNLSQPDYAECEDHVALIFTMEGGAKSVVTADFLRPQGAPTRNDDRLRVMGTKGYVEIRAGQCFLASDSEREEVIENAKTDSLTIAQGLFSCALGKSSYVTWEDALYTTKVCLSARDSADAGSYIRL